MCCGHKDGVPPRRNLGNAYEMIKETRKNDAFWEVKEKVFEILQEPDAVTG